MSFYNCSKFEQTQALLSKLKNFVTWSHSLLDFKVESSVHYIHNVAVLGPQLGNIVGSTRLSATPSSKLFKAI